MRILMLGWEFPPKITGGLGVASQGLAEALAGAGHDVTFLLPKKHRSQVSKLVKLVDASQLKPDLDFWKKKKERIELLRQVEIGHYLLPYLPPKTFEKARERQEVLTELESTAESELLEQIPLTGTYEGHLHAELTKYALLAVQVALKEKFDVIHAHDWITFRAGTMIHQVTGLPLCVHVHSTEHDRNGMYANPQIIQEERNGLQEAQHIFAVSGRVKETITQQYGIPARKITVAPNALNGEPPRADRTDTPKTIAFIGRLTHQKSPATFIDIARDLISRGNEFNYLIIGDGYLRAELEDKVAGSNLKSRIQFTGFMERTKVLRQLSHIDLLIVPSLSEPFGLVVLEAILRKIPVAAASGLGIAEFVPSLPQVERWDQFSYVNNVEKLMNDQKLRKTVTEACLQEARALNWPATLKVVEQGYAKLKRTSA